MWFLLFTGLAALIWFLIRVLPKPSRAAYPCQRVAQPLAAGFVVWVLGLIGSVAAYRRAKLRFHQSRYILGIACLIVAVMAIYWPISATLDQQTKAAPFVLVDTANTQIGEARGIHPGRVVWVYDPNLCDQNGSAGSWWEDRRTDPNVAYRMMARAILDLTGMDDLATAWDALFQSFNKTHGGDDVGYQAGERIAIKVNNIFSREYRWSSSQTNRPCPQMLYALLWQLVKVAGVQDTDITVYDCIFYHGDPVYTYCHKDFGGKTLLFFSECLRYRYWSAPPFHGGLTSSLFVSQDGVAIDSVLVDFLRSEGAVAEGSIDNYLHEAALADDPPSGTFYDPENDGIPLESLGVHEHWNNPTDRQYTRNLGTGNGIELIQSLADDALPSP